MKVTKPLPSIQFTKDGYEHIKKEYERLQLERKDAVEQLKKAREMGDLSENGFYKAAKSKLGSLDHQIQRTKYFIRFGHVAESISSESVQVGTTVIITDGEKKREIVIVGEHEADPLQGKISHRSPIGKGLLGKKIGDEITISIPKGAVTYTICKIG